MISHTELFFGQEQLFDPDRSVQDVCPGHAVGDAHSSTSTHPPSPRPLCLVAFQPGSQEHSNPPIWLEQVAAG